MINEPALGDIMGNNHGNSWNISPISWKWGILQEDDEIVQNL